MRPRAAWARARACACGRSGRPAHPVQYILIGLAQSIFVLLMVAYAEQIGFGPAYLISAGATVGLLAARQAGIGWSLTLHGISEFDYPAGNLLPAKLEQADFVACVSYFGMAQAMRLTAPALWQKLRLVRCAIDPFALPAKPAGAAAPATLRLVCVGRLSPEKGHAGLLDALATLTPAHPGLHLTIVGGGPEGAALKARVAALGVADAVTFAGRLHEAATLETIAGADGLVLASFMEGLPIVLMEAMALGVPVIASRVAGIPELVTDGETGLLFDPANWPALAACIARLADEPALGPRLAAAAKGKVAAEFAYPAAAETLAALFAGIAPVGSAKDQAPLTPWQQSRK